MDLQQRSRKSSAKAGSNNNNFGQLIPRGSADYLYIWRVDELVNKQVRSRVIKSDTKNENSLWGNT